ncbi:MAG: c-type cytochrome [Cryomorphaceae bacterium]|jgi:mono/diheme cytochrome c family protein|nr:c-type cytochrome [Cryomorphaceae bacterium]MDG1888829.1 c-type cytochrome [Flavobacteriaceae bacterium]MBT3503763.1 c-type cytochrome [Cryomorphaceae bacterium]MBT3688972.1 c-type cytochrome [Cryomorphaceae bacterium]MBT4221609.1 c-type cytochrome [Cryomorphaceae bacterium]|tara:strand:- start:672 stop:1076 length:405 start_codon:yes stop_codon:yes gene_type:complete
MKKILISLFFILIGCNSQSKNSNTNNKGIGPVSEVIFDEQINQNQAKSGEKMFNQLCSSCHMINEESLGPAIKGVINRRSPEWIMNMILNPTEMLQKDPIAKKLLTKYNNEYMYNQNLIEEEAREIIEYFRTLD